MTHGNWGVVNGYKLVRDRDSDTLCSDNFISRHHLAVFKKRNRLLSENKRYRIEGQRGFTDKRMDWTVWRLFTLLY